jgi:hypothetical protein
MFVLIWVAGVEVRNVAGVEAIMFRSGVKWHLCSKIICTIKIKHAAHQDIVNHVHIGACIGPQVVSGCG